MFFFLFCQILIVLNVQFSAYLNVYQSEYESYLFFIISLFRLSVYVLQLNISKLKVPNIQYLLNSFFY